jgi:Ni,Fe-hydrogenase I small subunit
MEANAPCTACVHPAFPDASNRALLKVGKKASGVFMEEEKEPVKPPVQKATTLAPIMKLLMD